MTVSLTLIRSKLESLQSFPAHIYFMHLIKAGNNARLCIFTFIYITYSINNELKYNIEFSVFITFLYEKAVSIATTNVRSDLVLW